MLRLMRAEWFRLLRKRSSYIYFGGLILAFFAQAYIRSGGFGPTTVLDDALTNFGLLPALAGGFVFAAVYTDDLNSRGLITLVGFGMSKTKIIIAKLGLTVLLTAIVYGLAPVVHCAVFAILGWPVTAATWGIIYAASLKFALLTLAFVGLAGSVVYGLQRPAFAIVAYILLAFGVVGGLVSTVLRNVAPPMADFLASGITDRVFTALTSGGTLTWPLIQYAVYLAIAVSLSVVAFHKKELEF